jgi:hypothetical protein
MKQGKPTTVNVDVSKIPSMKCYCGADVFSKVYNLKYISSILCGDPQGATVHVYMYKCALCGQLFPKAVPLAEVEKLYNALDPVRKAQVDAIKAKLIVDKE